MPQAGIAAGDISYRNRLAAASPSGSGNKGRNEDRFRRSTSSKRFSIRRAKNTIRHFGRDLTFH